MTKPTKISQRGLDLIKAFEGFEATAYLCPANRPTIGYGHTASVTMEDVRKRRTITRGEAEDLLRLDVERAEAAVRTKVTAELNQNQFDALVSFTFNVGTGAFGMSTLRKCLNANDFAGAIRQFPLWCKVRRGATYTTSAGLKRRREAEVDLFCLPADHPSIGGAA